MIRSHHDLPPPVFAGFFPKLTAPAPPELVAAGVAEIASVSDCMSSASDGWIYAWKHNDHGFYDAEDDARSVVPADAGTAYDLYAYEIVPVEHAGDMHLIEVTPSPGKVPADYEFLGYDVASRSVTPFFECSPWSCNLGANTFRVNIASSRSGALASSRPAPARKPGGVRHITRLCMRCRTEDSAAGGADSAE